MSFFCIGTNTNLDHPLATSVLITQIEARFTMRGDSFWRVVDVLAWCSTYERILTEFQCDFQMTMGMFCYNMARLNPQDNGNPIFRDTERCSWSVKKTNYITITSTSIPNVSIDPIHVCWIMKVWCYPLNHYNHRETSFFSTVYPIIPMLLTIYIYIIHPFSKNNSQVG